MSQTDTDYDIEMRERFRTSFPAPEPREYQKEVVETVVEKFEVEDKDLIKLDAPPGFGKSITLWTILDMLDGSSFYVTPLKSLQDQLLNDDFVGDGVIDIKGRSNYPCILPDAEPGTTVDKGKCQRESDFECDIKDECPYYKRKYSALQHPKTVMNLSYLMAEGQLGPEVEDAFGNREVMVIDEVQSLDDWAINFVGFTVSEHTIPSMVWDDISMPSKKRCENFDFMAAWVKDTLLPQVRGTLEYFDSQPSLEEDGLDAVSRLREFETKVERFLEDVKEHHWVSTYDERVYKNRPNTRAVEFKPIKVGRFLDSLVWSRADKFILSSATIPQGNWDQEIGIQDMDRTHMKLPSSFPVENRPIVTGHAVGKMTYKEKEKTMPKMVKKIKSISEHHKGEKGIVHCRGYNYIKMFKRACKKIDNDPDEDPDLKMFKWFRENVQVQDRQAREESLEEWINNDKQIFLSVNMAEGIDLKGDKCRWQVLLKTKYPAMGDERVNYRINEMNDWKWYNGKAAVQLEQAYGRAVRSSDDEAVFYLLDSSAVDLINRNKDLFHNWFLEAME